MQVPRKSYFLSFRSLAFGLLGLLVVFNLIAVVYSIFTRGLHADEFQHIHFAWNMYFYDLVIYRDFWDHHGVIYALINFLFLSITKAQASFDLYYYFRLINLVYIACYLVLAYKIAEHFFKDKLPALASIGVLTTLYQFQSKALEIRPDMLQNAFWLSALYLVFRYIHSYSVKVYATAGFLLGLAAATNLKAIGGAGLVFLFLLLDLVIKRTEVKQKIMRLVWMSGAFALVHLVILAYFIFVGAGFQYLKNAYYANFIVLDRVQKYFIKLFEEAFVWNIIPTTGLFLLLSFAGIALLVWANISQKKKEEVFFIFVTIGCLLTAPFGLWTQYYLVFAPLLSILAVYFLCQVISLVKYSILRMFLHAVAIAALLVSLTLAPTYDPQVFLNAQLLEAQRDETNTILEMVDREERIGFFWNMHCGGYVFNRDVQYYSLVDPIFDRVYQQLEGREVLGDEYIQALKDHNVRLIVAHYDYYPPAMSEYVRDGIFQRTSSCLLELIEDAQ